MKAVLACVGLVLLCTLSVSAEVPVQSNFETSRFIGKWYGIGIASDADWFLAKKDKMKMCTTVMKPTADGKLDVTLTFHKPDGCRVMQNIYTPTNQPGYFQYTSTRWGNDNDVRVVETNYDEYALIHILKTKGTQTSTMVKLYGRTQNLRPELVEKFKQFCLQQGFTPANILILPKAEECSTAV